MTFYTAIIILTTNQIIARVNLALPSHTELRHDYTLLTFQINYIVK